MLSASSSSVVIVAAATPEPAYSAADLTSTEVPIAAAITLFMFDVAAATLGSSGSTLITVSSTVPSSLTTTATFSSFSVTSSYVTVVGVESTDTPASLRASSVA